VPGDETNLLAVTQRPWAERCMTEPSDAVPSKAIPSRRIFATRDNSISR
jgi:hypothetical protein